MAPPKRGSLLGRDVAVSTAGLLVTRVVSAGGGVLAARLLGPSRRGEYALITLVVAIVGTAATFGCEYWVAAATARGAGEDRVRAVIRRQTRHGGVAILTVAALFFLGVRLLGAPVSGTVVLAGTAFAIANVASMLALALLGGYRRMGRVAVAQAAGAVSYTVMVAALLVTDRAQVAYVVAAAMLSTVVLAGLARTRSSSPRSVLARADYREATRLGLPAMVGELTDLALTRLDLFVVAFLLTPADVGRYAVATSLAEMLWVVPQGATQVLLPQVARDARGNATAPLVLVSGAITLVGAGVVTLVGPTLVPELFGQAFAPAVKALPWLAMGIAALGAARLLMADLAARGHTAIRARAAFIAWPVMIGADFLLIPIWGIGGAGVASLIAYVIVLVLTVRVWRHASGQSLRRLVDIGNAVTLVRNSVVSAPRPNAAVAGPVDPILPPGRGA